MMPLQRFDAILIDMNGTFMFGQDRFGPQEDYHLTYRKKGGGTLSSGDVQRAVEAVVAAMATLYRDPSHCDPFPSVASVLDALPIARELPSRERELIEVMIAEHELGHVPISHAEALRRLSALRPLMLLSNIWSVAAPWRDALAHDDLLDLFDATVFSSEHGCVKPATRLYDIARRVADVPFERIISIGDDPVRDIAVPSHLGMLTAQVGTVGLAEADMSAADLPELVGKWL